MTRVLMLCTGNSCRSQMAEALLGSCDASLDVSSAGTFPASRVRPLAAEVMAERGIDIASAVPKSVDRFLKDSFDYVITVCGDAEQNCPVFSGNVKRRLHIPFDDPAKATGTPEEVRREFVRIRDEIAEQFSRWWDRTKKGTGHD